MNEAVAVTVRWFDGYKETFEAAQVRFGFAMLWLKLTNGENRHIPFCQVRTFSTSRDSRMNDSAV